MCCDFVGGWVAYGFKFGLVFGVRLQARRCFEIVMVALGALFIKFISLFPEGVYYFAVGLVYDGGYGFVA